MNEEVNLPEGLQLAVKLLAQIGDDESDRAIAAVHAAADERDELRAKYDELLVALHGIGAALGIQEGDRSPYSVTCGVLERVNRLAEIEAQEPACWAVIDPTGGGSVEYTAAWREACHEHIGDMITEADMPEAANFLVRPLYARPIPAQAVPEIKEGADYTLHIVADSGYEATTTGRCSAEQYGRAMGALHNTAPEHKA